MIDRSKKKKEKKEKKTYPLRNTLSNNSNGLDLGALHQLHGGGVDGPRGRKVDDSVNIWVLGHGLGGILVDGQKRLTGTPVHLAHELTPESVDNTGHGRSGAFADKIKVQHTLDGSGLHATITTNISIVCVIASISSWFWRFGLLDEASCLVVKESMRERREDPTRRAKPGNVVIGRL